MRFALPTTHLEFCKIRNLVFFVHFGFTLPAAAAAAAEQTATAVAAGEDTARPEEALKDDDASIIAISNAGNKKKVFGLTNLKPFRRQHHERTDGVIPELVGHVQTERSVFVIDFFFLFVRQD